VTDMSLDRWPQRGRVRNNARPSALLLGRWALLGVLGFLILMPLYRLQGMAFEDGASGYSRAFSRPGSVETIVTTVFLAVGSLLIGLVLGTALAWAASRLPARLRFLRVVPVLPIVLPPIAAVLGWALLFSPRPGYGNGLLRQLPWWNGVTEGPADVYTLPWIVLITGLALTSFVYLFVSAGYSNINHELIEAARVSGSTEREVFFRVTLPLLRPSLVYGGAVALLLGLGQFTAPLMLGRNAGIDVLTTDMYLAVSRMPVDYGQAAAIASPLLIFGVLIVLLQMGLVRDHGRFVTHGGKSFRSDDSASCTAVGLILGYGLVAIVLPTAALVIMSLSPFWGDINVATFTLENFRKVLATPGITDAIKTSLFASMAAVSVTLPLGFLCASILVRLRHHGTVRTLIDFIVTLPLGIPAAVFGVGFLLTYTAGPFVLYGTRWVIVLAYVTLMVPFATRMQLSALVSLGSAYEEASRTSGAGALRTKLRIVLPLIRRSIGGAAALMFVLLTHEFAASLLVRSPKTDVMGTILYQYWTNGSYPTVAAIAIIMTLITGAGVFLAMAVGGGDFFDEL